ncbi:MAG: O-antigen ligase family protein [Anaerolineae bacterium]|nr:O-antigen ligase family protein [Anaerolineae bacterium]
MEKVRSLLRTVIASGLVVFLVLLPFHLVIKRLVPGAAGTYWKEALLGLLILLWAIHCLLDRRLLLTGTPLDGAVLTYLGLLFLRFVLDRSGWVGAWGLYVSAMYLPLFWLVPTVLRQRPGRATLLTALLVAVCGVVALGGLVEFALDVALWPSDELLQRQGFADMFIYGTHIRRVYFTFDSPTTLANTLALVLPLAIVLAAQARHMVARLAAGLAAMLMAACIVVTFSRGIWVATALALLVMGLLSGFIWRNRRFFAAAAGALLLLGITWGAIALVRVQTSAPASAGVVELSPAAYEAAPVTHVERSLLQVKPAAGELVTQTWTLHDPITGRDDTRIVLYEHPPESGKSEIVYNMRIPESGALRFAIALSPEVWSPEKGDGASFQLYIAEPGASQGQFVFVRYINPKHNPSDRRWRNFLVDLSPWAGRMVNLSLITEAGPAGDWSFDWAGWAELEVVRVVPDYFASAATENAILRHTGSVLDWARDETNRDRLAAWGLAWSAWRASPFWGTGLGTTGVAALRTRPERAFVTESQVLKALVELGIPGLLVWAYLWFTIARVGLHTYRTAEDPTRRALLLGILIGLLVIFIESLVYQNLEVKQVNAYFWTLVGCIGALAGQQDE